MTLRHLLLSVSLGTAVLAVAVAPSCSYYNVSCTFGVWPPDGAVDVPTSDALLLVHPSQFAVDVPALAPGITLRDRTSGGDVPFTVRLHDDGAQVFVTPDAPLIPGHVYRLTGVDDTLVQNIHRWWWYGRSVDLPVTSTFTVGDTPHRTGTGTPSDLQPAVCVECEGCDTGARPDTGDSSDDVTLDDEPWDSGDTDLPPDSDTDLPPDSDPPVDSDTDTDATVDTDAPADSDTDLPADSDTDVP